MIGGVRYLGRTALLSCALAAWLVGAVLASEPEGQADMATAALGGRRGRTGLDLVLVGLVAGGLTLAFLAYPLLLSGLARPLTFSRPVRPGDVLAAALAQLSCAGLGGALAVLFAPPRITRRATSVVAVLVALLAFVAVSGRLGAFGGPAAVTRALTDARPGTLEGPEVVAYLSCGVLLLACLAAADWWTRRRA